MRLFQHHLFKICTGLVVYWLALFAAFRLWFVLWFRAEWSASQPGTVWESFVRALPLDTSTLSYLVVLPVLIWFAGAGAGGRAHPWAATIFHSVQYVLIGLLVLILGANIFIYEEWHTLINNRAVAYMSTPGALFNSMSAPFQIVAVTLYAAALWLFVKIYHFFVPKNIFPDQTIRQELWVLPAVLGLVFIGIRGGLGVMPINESAVYYAAHPFNNHAATNPAWYLMHSFLEVRSTVNRFTADTDVQALRPGLLRTYTEQAPLPVLDTTLTTKPNVVFIIMESMTAQVIEELGGEKGVCPNISGLIRDGVLFSNCYSSGYRTDQGLVSILAGYPAQPDQSIIVQIDKGASLHSVPKYLKTHAGYSSMMLYGSDLTFANFKVWLSNQQIDPIIGRDDFTKAEQTQHWGADDAVALQRGAQETGQLKEPFCATLLTLSLHPPYDAPCAKKWPDHDLKGKFLNHAAFTDAAVGAFFETARKQPWFAHTVFVLVADHGASGPSGLGMDRLLTRHIPLVLYSPLLKKTMQGTRVPVWCNHSDIPATILRCIGQNDYPRGDFAWSRDIFSMNDWFVQHPHEKSNNFAYYTNEDGLGWSTPEGTGFYRFANRQWNYWPETGNISPQSQEQARAYLHLLYDDFLSR